MDYLSFSGGKIFIPLALVMLPQALKAPKWETRHAGVCFLQQIAGKRILAIVQSCCVNQSCLA